MKIKGRLIKKEEKNNKKFYAMKSSQRPVPIWIRYAACAAQAINTSSVHSGQNNTAFRKLVDCNDIKENNKKEEKKSYEPQIEPATSASMDKRWCMRSAGTWHLTFS